ncbi:MAG: signal peptidase [Blastocatellia bacterium]|jgi:signal peptidase I|nr:signal peptidase [Blastocatellia bacterium]
MRHSTKLAAILVPSAMVLAALVVVLSALPFIQERLVQGKDMEPTLHEGDRILATKRKGHLRRGDIVIFQYPADRSKTFVKRLIALPGELIEIRAGKVSINGQPLQEEYVDARLNHFPYNASPKRIPVGNYYVMGDNRDNSNDSRMWGPLPEELIQSKLLFHY